MTGYLTGEEIIVALLLLYALWACVVITLAKD